MDEVQSWWEVPSITHFCYAFRSVFNLFFFEIAELESALLNIHDPDLSISLEQLIIKLLQGCYDEETVGEENWEEKLRELFNGNLKVDENPFDSSAYFFQLTPRSKVEVLLKLCELRLDVDDVLDVIKNIPSEDMQAKCLGKDSSNFIYWYFCDDRLYKEDTSSRNKTKEFLKNKSAKKTPIKKQTSTREKRKKASPDIDKSWMVACFNLSDWEKLMKQLSKSRNSNEKELSISIKNHLPLIQERVAEKDRLLRKRYLELAPKRTSSRISKVQEKKKNEELKAAEEARIAQIEKEKERAKKEALLLKEQKESRQKRIEERHKAIEERADRVKLRELARDESDDSDEDNNDEQLTKSQKVMPSRTQRSRRNIKWRYQESESEDEEMDDNEQEQSMQSKKEMPLRAQRSKRNVKWRYQESESEDEESEDNYQPSKSQKVLPFGTQRSKRNVKWRYQESESEDEIGDNESGDQFPQNGYKSTSRRTVTTKLNDETADPNCSRYIRTYSKLKNQSGIGEPRTSSRLQSNAKSVKYQYDFDETEEQESSEISRTNCRKSSSVLQSTEQNSEKSGSEDSDKESSCDVTNTSSNGIKINIRNSSSGYSVSNQDPRVALPNNSNRSHNFSSDNVYKTVLQNTSDVSKCNSTLDSEGQNLHVLHSSHSNLASKKLKVDHFKTISPNAKENQHFKPVQKSSFITYGKILPSPSVVKLEYRKPSNSQVSS